MSECATCGGHGWAEVISPVDFSASVCPTCKGSGTDKPSVTHYNDLVPPENSAHPWKPEGWQLLCYYCAQPIFEEQAEAGYRQRTVYMRGRWRHRNTNRLYCEKEDIRLDTDLPRCHICGTQTAQHRSVCSAAGLPTHRATPMSGKEEELIAKFGWKK
jgi:hypothetical protein